MTAPRLFGDVLGYEAEVCEPNAEPVRAWVTDRYGQEAQVRFEAWLRGARANLSGEITRACLDNGMSAPDACETAAVVLSVLDARQGVGQ